MGRIMNTSDKARDSKSLYSRRPDCKSARTEKFGDVLIIPLPLHRKEPLKK